MKLTKDRMYEIVEVEEDHIWHEELGHSACLVGLIVKIDSPAEAYTQILLKDTKNSTFTPGRPSCFVQVRGITFRPLNLKDQAAIENAHGS